MPGPADNAAWTAEIIERPADNGPYGAKGIGEMTANAPIPAIANAIFDACGVRLTEMPFTPERVLRGLDELRARDCDPDRDTLGRQLADGALLRGRRAADRGAPRADARPPAAARGRARRRQDRDREGARAGRSAAS